MTAEVPSFVWWILTTLAGLFTVFMGGGVIWAFTMERRMAHLTGALKTLVDREQQEGKQTLARVIALEGRTRQLELKLASRRRRRRRSDAADAGE